MLLNLPLCCTLLPLLAAAPANFVQLTSSADAGAEGSPSDVRAYSPDMTRPQRVAGPFAPELSADARKRGGDDLAIVRCTITRKGAVRDCHIIKSVPDMDENILAWLKQVRYSPALLRGEPVEVSYAINVRVKASPNPATQQEPLTSPIYPLSKEMTRPVRIEGPSSPEYSLEARRHRVEGLVSIRCVVTQEGTLRNCSILKTVPYMDESILAWLPKLKYTPARFHGEPVAVSYVLQVHLQLRTPPAETKPGAARPAPKSEG